MAEVTSLTEAVGALVRDGDAVAIQGMANRYAAGASGMPCALMRGYVGTELGSTRA